MTTDPPPSLIRPRASGRGRDVRAPLAAIAILVLTVVVYLPLRDAGFVSDDDFYVKENSWVRAGLTGAGVLNAFTIPVAANWHPLTMLSLMLDVALFGPGPRGFHLMNVFYHALAGVLTFLVLRRLTGATWRSALVAAVFAVHPLHVESVAWISERKDVLSGVFFWLCLGAYGRYVAAPSPRRGVPVAAFLALGLLAKPMLVTVPPLLLVLDFWPLGRLRRASGAARILVREKLPLLALSALFSLITLVAQTKELQSLDNLPFAWRLENATLSYVRYLGNALWPARLYFLHPYGTEPPGVAPALGAVAALLALTVVAVLLLRRRPAGLSGLLWYLGMLLPVIGLVQVGGQTYADRYMYLPLTGVCIALVWPVADLLRSHGAGRLAVSGAAAALVAALALAANDQSRIWESASTLYGNSLDSARPHEKWLAHYGVGVALSDAGDLRAAAEHYRASLALRPDWGGARNNYATVLLKEGRPAEALAQYGEAVRLMPGEAKGHYGVGLALVELGRDADALVAFGEALRLRPDFGSVYTDLGATLARLGRLAEAESAFRSAMRLLPLDSLPPYNLGLTLAAAGRQQEAIETFLAAVRLRPEFADAYNDLGVSYAATGQVAAAVGAFETALRIQPGLVAARRNLERAREQNRR